MAIADDWTIDYVAKTIEHTSGTTVYTTLAFFQWLAATFADLDQLDDEYAFVSDTPQVYRFVNGWAFGSPTSDYKFLSGGAITSSDGDELWSNLYTIGTQVAGTQIYIVQDGAVITPYWGTGNIDILVHAKTGGVLIDSGIVLVMAREYGHEYDHNFVDLSAGGRNVAGINTALDTSNTTAAGTVATWAGDFTVTFGSYSEDLNNSNGLNPYEVKILAPTRSESDIYEYTKYITRRGETSLLDGVQGQLYRSADSLYIDVKKAPFGTIAAGKIFGARGVWYETTNSNFELKDSNNVTQAPPVYRKVTCSNALLVGTKIFVAEIDTIGGSIIKNSYTVSSTTSNTIVTTAPISQAKVPQSGSVKIGSNFYNYTGFSGSTFTGVTPNPTGETGDFYVPLIALTADATTEVSDNVIYSTDFPVRTTVRKYGFQEYTNDATFTDAGLTFSPILTVSPQAT